jgi:hypothetical protein
MTRILSVVCLFVLIGFAFSALAAESNIGTKTGVIKSVDAQAKTFVLTIPPKPITFTVDDSTKFTLDGKKSTFEAAIKPDATAIVNYNKSGDQFLATTVDVTPVTPK